MITRGTKFKVLLFVVITLLGITYVGANYVGLDKYIGGDDGCQISADFPDSGGIFSNAEVTYRGVTVGKVGALQLIKNGVRVDLDLDDCSSAKIPANSGATIANRSVVGEQYVNLVPASNTGSHPSYLRAGADIPMSRNKLPVATQTLLTNLDDLVRSVDLNNLRITVTELGNAVNGRGNDLGHLLDATNSLLTAANQPDNLDATIALINDSGPVLQTQLSQADPLKSWTHSLRLLSGQLKASDPDIRRLFTSAPADLSTVHDFIVDNRTDIGVVLSNLVTTGRLLVAHLGGLDQVLELYPALAAGGVSALKNDTGKLGLVVQTTPQAVPQDCGKAPNSADRQGYGSTVVRDPTQTGAIAPNVTARCTGPLTGANYTDPRGSAHVPGGDPISLAGGGRAYPRVLTKNVAAGDVVAVSNRLNQPTHLGDASWLNLLTDSLH